MSGRIPQHFINQLLSRVDIIDVVDKRIHLKKKGANHHACCPFHQEKTPSFTVNQQKQFYYCFGCGAHGNAIGFVMEFDHVSFVEAVEELARSLNLEIPYEAGSAPEITDALKQKYELLNKATQFFEQQLRQHPEATQAVDYLKGRGLSGQIAKQYLLGYAPSGWDNLLKAFGANTSDALLEVGLVIRNEQGRYYDRFRHRVMFPIRDRRGRTIGFGGRVLNADEQPKYLNSPETPVFHKGHELYGLYEARQALNHFEQLLIVEGYMDVIALAQYDIRYAVATLGTATTADHLQILFKQTENLIFCFDGDRAGRQAAWRALKVALPFMTGQYRLQFLFLPETEDPDSLVRKEGKAAFENRLKQAMPLSTFLLQTLSKQVDLSNIDGRAHLVSLAQPYLKLIPASAYATLLHQELARLAQLPADQITSNVYGKAKSVQDKPEKITATRKIMATSTLEQAIAWLLQYPDLARSIEHPHLHAQNQQTKLCNELFSLVQQEVNLNVGGILERYKDQPEVKRLAELAIWSPPMMLENNQQEFFDIIAKLKQAEELGQLENLIEKAKYQTLSDSEKQKLRKILQQTKK